jgi:hypothetical protein
MKRGKEEEAEKEEDNPPSPPSMVKNGFFHLKVHILSYCYYFMRNNSRDL